MLKLASALFVSCGFLQAAQTINGAGATFPYPLYSKWFSEYGKQNTEVQINYQSIGSGGGIRQFLDRTIDFGASDTPMTDEQLAKSTIPIIHIPTVMGAVVIAYNLPGVNELKLTPELVANIFLGKVPKWSDPAIKALNPALGSDSSIIVVHRSDGSGTTAIFSDYLCKVSNDWKTKVGQGTALNWPTGLGGKGNEGVTGLVKQTPGSLGYVELVYAETNKLAIATLKNKAGEFVRPTLQSITKAAASLKDMPNDFRMSITDPDGKDAYPIAGLTYLLVYKVMPDPVKAAGLVRFLKWSMDEGQKLAPRLLYAPLPNLLLKKVKTKIDTIEIKKAS